MYTTVLDHNSMQTLQRIHYTHQYSLKTMLRVWFFFIYSIHATHTRNHYAASRCCAGSSQRTSSTSQAILSLSRQRGKNALALRVQPWKASTGTSSQARCIGHDEKNCSMGMRKTPSTPLWGWGKVSRVADRHWRIVGIWFVQRKQKLSQIIT